VENSIKNPPFRAQKARLIPVGLIKMKVAEHFMAFHSSICLAALSRLRFSGRKRLERDFHYDSVSS
jgi:hypothetical protein